MKNLGMFGRGNINLNQAETKYLTNFVAALVGFIIVIILNLILLGLIYWGLEASNESILICIILLGVIQILWAGIALYVMRGFIREDAFDWTSQVVSFIPQIMNSGSGMMSHASGMMKEGRNEAMNWAQLIGEVEQLKRTYESLIANSQDMSGNVAPLPGSGNIDFTPFIDGD